MLGTIRTTVLPNGCRVVTSAMPGVDSFSLCFDAGTGGRFERPAEGGFSHFLEHMLFKGSRKRPSTKAISRPLERVGGQFNAYTSAEHTCFHALVPADAAALAADVLGDMFAHPLFDPAEIERERLVVLEEIKMYHDDPASHAADLSLAGLWPRHPLGRPVLGTPRTLEGAGHGELAAYHRARYSARGTVVAAAGRLEHERVVDLVRPWAEELPAGPAPAALPASRAAAPAPVTADLRETQQVQAVVSFRSFGRADPRRSAATLLSHLLGGGLTSRLFMSVRERHGLAYSISSANQGFRDAGAFQVYAGLDAARAAKGLALVARELRAFAEKGPGAREFADARRALAGMQRLGGETSASQMSWILSKLRWFGRVETPDEVVARLLAVRPEEVRDLARDLFRPDNLSLALVMPRGGADTPETLLDAARL
ncbi:MAG: insulinase family protein [Kiritimatiellae bacterium]|nr:insulinase family protein [Kiritimatiellia bacterium]